MEAKELIKQLEELRDTKDYSQSKLLNTGYRTGLLDALDLVNEYFDLNLFVGKSEQLPDDKLYKPCEGCTDTCKNWEIFFCKIK